MFDESYEKAHARAVRLLCEKADSPCGWLSDLPDCSVETDKDRQTVTLFGADGQIDLEAVVDYVFQAIDETREEETGELDG